MIERETVPPRELYPEERWVMLPDGTSAIMWVPPSMHIPAGHTIQLVPIPGRPGVSDIRFVPLQ
jgi:hypothetical protein